MAERILEDYETAYGLKSVIFRYFNAAGADPAGRSGENHTPETHLIPLVLDVAAGRNPHITVFGDDYDTDDGTCVRDYIHVSDIASAHLLGLDFLEEYETSERFNLANAVGYSVKQVIDSVSRITNRPIKTVYAKRRAGDPPVLIGNASKALSILGWKPQFTELDTIVKHAWKWHQQLIGF